MRDNEPFSDLDELRRAAINDPLNGVLRYLLGAELAHLQDYDAALLEFSAAIALDPSLDIARFQLGLLHLTLAQPDQAVAALSPLESLSDGDSLKHFKRGLEALIHDDLSTFLRCMKLGIELNTNNQTLNRDMKTLLSRVQEHAALHSSGSSTDAHTDFSPHSATKH